MNIESILTLERTVSLLSASSKKRAIELAAINIVNTLPDLEVGQVYRSLIEREKLGSTAIGDGVAIPHCRLANCNSIVGGLFVFKEPVNFSAHDNQPVQIMFVLLVPESETSEHLAALAMLAERFGDEVYRTSLLNAADSQQLYDCAVGALPSAEQEQ